MPASSQIQDTPVASKPVILCGMYAFSPVLENAWGMLLGSLHRHLEPPAIDPFEIRYRDDTQAFHDKRLYLGQTCGYPYRVRYMKTHEIISVPEFDVEGCAGLFYSSWLVARADDSRMSLEDFRSGTAVVNNFDSNSGMNVFRHAVSRIAHGSAFFSEVRSSGSHLASLRMVRHHEGDFASIDAVTYGLATELGLVDPSDFRILAQTEATPGLPFIASRRLRLDPETITAALNAALECLRPAPVALLRIRRFSTVDSGVYRKISDLEQAAVRAGYPHLA